MSFFVEPIKLLVLKNWKTYVAFAGVLPSVAQYPVAPY